MRSDLLKLEQRRRLTEACLMHWDIQRKREDDHSLVLLVPTTKLYQAT